MKNDINKTKIRYTLFNYIALLLLLAPLLFTFACSTQPVERNYYTINYTPTAENKNYLLKQSLPYRVQISDSRIARIYDRNQIVVRYSQHRIEYANLELWGVRLSSSIPDAITEHVTKYNLFAVTQRDFFVERPEYDIVTNVNKLEFLQSDFYRAARLEMDISLRRSDDLSFLVKHSINREQEIYTDSYEIFVQQISRMINEEMEIFIGKTLQHFDAITSAELTVIKPQQTDDITADSGTTSLIFKEADLESSLAQESYQTWLMPPIEEQLLRETQRDLVGLGRLFLPAMSSPELEPFYFVYSEDDYTNYYTMMGTSLYLKPGDYSLHYGSGSENQLMKQSITITRDQMQIVEPDWGGLRVRLIDEGRNALDNQYELFNMDTVESFGFSQGALEEFGEQIRTWILKPGRYKLVLNNFPYNTLKDFATVDIVPGELRTLTLVIDEDSNSLIGAGILETLEQSADRSKWRVSSTIHGNFSFNSANSTDKNNPTLSMLVTTQFDTRVNYDVFPYYYSLRNLVDFGVSKDRDIDLRISTDNFKLRNTFIYYLYKFFGVYGRLDSETHFFHEYYIPSSNENFRLRDSDGNKIKDIVDTDRLRTKISLYPMVFQEGVGFNFRALNRPKASLNIRTGFGMRQDIYKHYYQFIRSEVDPVDNLTYQVYDEIASNYKNGIEVTILANIHLPLNVIYNTTAEVLIPFEKEESNSYNWENIVSLRLIRAISVDYRLNLAYNKNIRDYTEIAHNLFLRLTYFLY